MEGDQRLKWTVEPLILLILRKKVRYLKFVAKVAGRTLSECEISLFESIVMRSIFSVVSRSDWFGLLELADPFEMAVFIKEV